MRKLLLLAASCLCLAYCSGKGDATVLTFSTDDVISDYFVGAGVQWSAYPHADTEDSEWGKLMTEEKWQELYRRVDYLSPRYMRVMDQANWRYFMGLDRDGKVVLDFENPQTDALFHILDYCQTHDVVVMIGEWGVPGQCHDKDNPSIRLDTSRDPRWFEMIGEWVDYLLNVKKYTCIKYYDYINEPNGSWSCVAGNFDDWQYGVKQLHTQFEKRGLTDRIGISGPGSVPNANVPRYKDIWPGNRWVLLARDAVGGILTSYNTHAYYPHMCVRAGKAAEYMFFAQDVPVAHDSGKPFFLGEIGLKATKDGGEFAQEHERRRLADEYASTDCNMFIYEYFYGLDIASAAIQSMNAGVDGYAVWDLDDAMHTKDDEGDIHRTKKWGFWNILGAELYGQPEQMDIRPWYWACSWLGRYLPPRTKLFRIDGEFPDGCQILAGRTPEGQMTVCAVNTSDQGASLVLGSDDLKGRFNMHKLEYNEALYSQNNPPYGEDRRSNVRFDKGFSFDLPAKTFVVYTSMKL